MTTYLDEVIMQARDDDAARPRSSQTRIGWSGMADCRSYMGFKMQDEWGTDDDDNWRAIAGSALHTWMHQLRSWGTHEAGEEASFELDVSYGGIPGHVDEVNWTRGEVTEWKFPKLSSARVWDDPDVLEEKFVQPQGYAAAIADSAKWQGLHPDKDPLVRMLVAPVDGSFDDWRIYERDFHRQTADDALARYRDVVDAIAQGLPLPKDKPWFFCERFCEFFTLCRGGTKDDELSEITDPELAAAVERYGLANEQESMARKVKEELSPQIRGLRGTARGWKINLTRPGAGRMVYDERAIEATFNASGWEIPLIPVKGKPASLRVTREKKVT